MWSILMVLDGFWALARWGNQLKPAQNQQTTRFNRFLSAVRMLLTTTGLHEDSVSRMGFDDEPPERFLHPCLNL